MTHQERTSLILLKNVCTQLKLKGEKLLMAEKLAFSGDSARYFNLRESIVKKYLKLVVCAREF